jgi:hypothetical protein
VDHGFGKHGFAGAAMTKQGYVSNLVTGVNLHRSSDRWLQELWCQPVKMYPICNVLKKTAALAFCTRN